MGPLGASTNTDFASRDLVHTCLTDLGITLDPRNFGETVANFSLEESEGVARNGSSNATSLTIVFFDSPSRDQAVDIARVHPGLHYGVTVEVREWVSPREIVLNK